ETAEATETAQATPSSVRDLLLAAREAYWSEDFERSAEFYQALLAQDNQPSYKGELANVFWKQGKSKEAVQLYSEIAVWLKDQGRMAELQNIKVYVDLVDPAIGEQIGALLK
ncbi:MAG: Multicopper oxidase, partial [uncultured Thiotrichaceae bacterium]